VELDDKVKAVQKEIRESRTVAGLITSLIKLKECRLESDGETSPAGLGVIHETLRVAGEVTLKVLRSLPRNLYPQQTSDISALQADIRYWKGMEYQQKR
jgi:hypothetical protein